MNLGPDPIPRPISRSASASASATPTQNQTQTKPRSRSRSQTPAPAPGAGAGNLSRTPSRASRMTSASGVTSNTNTTTLSRNASLIKKNIELQDLRPADVLIERFVAWKAIVKQLTAWFEGIADIENNTAKELSKLAGVIQVPFRAGNQFLGEGGLQDVYYDLRNKTRMIADTHADLGRTIDSSIVQHLQKLRAEIKAHIKNVQNDTGKLAAGVAKERELSTKLVGELANSISTFKNTPMNVHAKNDPYIANLSVTRQLTRQVHEENLLHKSLIMTQQSSAHFELGIIKSLQSAYASFDEWNARSSTTTSLLFSHIARGMRELPVDKEWIQFAARSESLLDPETPLRDVERIRYPLMDEACVRALHKGHMERKKRFTRAWRESYFVLTPAGFLHEYETADEDAGPGGNAGGAGGGGGVRGKAKGQTPVFSLFLPSCTLGPASSPRGGSHKFHIEGRKDGLGTTKSGSFKGLLSGEGSGGESNKAWSFRCKSREEMMEWWNDIRMLCARYLVASESVDRTGPVEEAVRSVGYVSEDWEDEEDEEGEGEGELDEDEDEEGAVVDQSGLGLGLPPPISRIGALSAGADADADEDGSSVEEEEEHEDHPPVYSHPHPQTAVEKHHNNYMGMGVGGGGIEIGPNGYAIEKKSPAHAPAPYPTQGPVGGGGGGGEDHIINYRSAPTTFLSPTLVRNGSKQDVKSQRAVIGGVADEHEHGEGGGVGEEGVDDDDEQGGAGGGGGEQGGGRVGRRLSKRQMEKAPEGVGRGRGGGVGGATPPPPIQLRDTGVVPPSSTQPLQQQTQTPTQSSRPGSASRYRSPPPASRTHQEEGEDNDEDEEGMYVSERDAEGEAEGAGTVSRPQPEHQGEHEGEQHGEGEGEEGADAPTVSTPQEETSPSSKSKKKKLRKGKKSGAASSASAPTTPGADADPAGDTDAKLGGTTKAVQGVGAAIGSALKGNGGGAGGGGGGGALDGDVD